MILTFTHGATTIDFQANGCKVMDGYAPQTPGGDEETLVEEFECLFVGTAANARALAASIDKLFLIAARNRKQIYPVQGIVYFNFDVDDTATAWRARIYGGRVGLMRKLDSHWRQGRWKFSVTLERDALWEGPEAQVPLTNLLGTDDISGLTIYNPSIHRWANTIAFVAATKKITDTGNGLANFKTGMTIKVAGTTSNDGTYTIATGGVAGEIVVNETLVNESAGSVFGISGPVCNYVHIDGADVAGDAPGLARLEIKNTYNSATRAERFFIGQNIWSSPGSLTYILQAEDASGETPTEIAAASNVQINQCEWNVTTETALLTWTLTSAMLNALAHNYVRFLLAFSTATSYTNLWLKIKIKLSTVTLWESEWSLAAGNGIEELAIAQLAPYLMGAADNYPLSLELSAKRDSGGTHFMYIDYLQLTVVDGWRKLMPKGFNLDYNVTLVDDNIQGLLYTTGWATAGKVGNYVGYGPPLKLEPGADQRLTFLHLDEAADMLVYRTCSVKLYYRPRRKAI